MIKVKKNPDKLAVETVLDDILTDINDELLTAYVDYDTIQIMRLFKHTRYVVDFNFSDNTKHTIIVNDFPSRDHIEYDSYD